MSSHPQSWLAPIRKRGEHSRLNIRDQMAAERPKVNRWGDMIPGITLAELIYDADRKMQREIRAEETT